MQINVVFVNGPNRKGRVSQITVPEERGMSIKDLREYILKCAKGEDGTPTDRNALVDLIEKSGVGIESVSVDPIEIIQQLMGTFMATELPNCPVVEMTHVLFLHPTPIQ